MPAHSPKELGPTSPVREEEVGRVCREEVGRVCRDEGGRATHRGSVSTGHSWKAWFTQGTLEQTRDSVRLREPP